MRRQGLPCNLVVERKGDLFVNMSRSSQALAILDILQLRLPFLKSLKVSHMEVPLSKEHTKQVMKSLFFRWSQDSANKKWCDEAWRSDGQNTLH